MNIQKKDVVSTKIERITEYDKKIGQRLKDKRTLCRLSQQKLGEAVGVSIQQIQKYEKASNRISAGKLMQFATLLQTPITYFFDGLEEAVMGKTKSSMAEAQEGFDGNNISERELLSMIRAYSGIIDVSVREGILTLARSLSAHTSGGKKKPIEA